MHKFVRALKGPAKFSWPLRGPFVLAARKFILSISESGIISFSAPKALREQLPGVKRCGAARNPRLEEP
jgi:hypothetical protein